LAPVLFKSDGFGQHGERARRMAGIKLQKREHDFFVSYGHADRASVEPWCRLLSAKCGLKLWFDNVDGNAAQRSSELLASAIGNTRGALFCLSEQWKRSSWCKSEYEVALNEQRAHEGFEIIALRLDDVEAPAWLQVAQIVDLRQAGGFARLLSSLSSDLLAASLRQRRGRVPGRFLEPALPGDAGRVSDLEIRGLATGW
jgi:hypothetical protein